MNLYTKSLVVTSLLFATGCGSTKVEQNRSGQPVSPPKNLDQTSIQTNEKNPSSEPPIPAPEVQPDYKSYPAKFEILGLPELKSSPQLYFGYSAETNLTFQGVLISAVIAYPSILEKNGAFPINDLDAKTFAFLQGWATEFQKTPAYQLKMDEFSKSNDWVADPNVIELQPVTIPTAALPLLPSPLNMLPRELIRVSAQRLIFKTAGTTTLNRTTDGKSQTIPLNIQQYTKIEVDAGGLLYNNPQTGCVGCHGSLGQGTGSYGAFSKHTAESLALYDDQQLLKLIKESTYPDGKTNSFYDHQFKFATVQDEQNLLAYLRNLKPLYDKALELLAKSGRSIP